jgi:type I restriction enzyme R subunit
VKEIAELLGEKDTIPMVREQMPLIHEVQKDEWRQDVTVPMLELNAAPLAVARSVHRQAPAQGVYTDFEDLIGEETSVQLPGVIAGTNMAKFRAKARAFLRQRLDHLAIVRLRSNKPLTTADLSELERILVESGAEEPNDVHRTAEESQGLGLFVRSLVGRTARPLRGRWRASLPAIF